MPKFIKWQQYWEDFDDSQYKSFVNLNSRDNSTSDYQQLSPLKYFLTDWQVVTFYQADNY